MKLLIIVILAIIGLAYCQVSDDSSSEEEVDSGELVNFLNLRKRYIPHYYPHHPIYPPVYPPMYPPHFNPSGSNCQTCVMIVSYLNQNGGSSVYSRNMALHNACSVVGAMNLVGCQQFVATYGAQLMHYVHPHSDPTSTCRSIHVC